MQNRNWSRKKIAEAFEIPMCELNRVDAAQVINPSEVEKIRMRFWKKIFLPALKKIAKQIS